MPICKILKKAMETYGVDHQTKKCVEEVGELLQAIAKYQNAHDIEEAAECLDHLQEEVADCCIMMEQMVMMYGEREITKKILEKSQRLEKRMSTEAPP